MLTLAAALLSGIAATAPPAEVPGLQASPTVERVIEMESEDGSTEVEYVPLDTASPGEELVYSLNFQNGGDAPVDGVVLILPVPEEVSFVEDSATTEEAAVDFSVDGGNTFSPWDALATPEGDTTSILATATITHVRWTLRDKIAPGQEGTLSFRAVLK